MEYPDSADEREIELTADNVGRWRLAIGFFQGICAWLLLRLVAPANYDVGANFAHRIFWSERHPLVFAALALVVAYVPVLASLEAGRMRWKRLVVYLASTALVLAGLAAYDLWREPTNSFNADPRVWPSFEVAFCTAIGLFIVNQLLEHRERGHALFAEYADHFESSWMRGFQVVVSLLFALLVWGILLLAADLFDLIHVGWVRATVQHNWFRCPVFAIAVSAAIHLTDVRPALLKGVRSVALTLLSWLLPLTTTLGIGFLLALAFVGMSPLWATHRAASIVLWSCALTIFFVNAAYEDGVSGIRRNALLRWSGRVAGPIIFLLATIATYAIVLRVRQYGLTPDRVLSCAVTGMTLIYGAGYTYATARRRNWLQPIESVNVLASIVAVAILVSLLTPIADPARLAVDSQLSRLASGKVALEKFDFQFLRFDSGEYGHKALVELTRATDPKVRSRAARMQVTKTRVPIISIKTNEVITEDAFSHATVYPVGMPLPEHFRDQDWSSTNSFGPDCLRNGGYCDIYVIAHGEQTILIVVPTSQKSGSGSDQIMATGLVYQLVNETWVSSGTFAHLSCPGVVAALRQGQVNWIRPEHDDLVANGVRLDFSILQRVDYCVKKESLQRSGPHPPPDARAPVHMGPAFGGQ